MSYHQTLLDVANQNGVDMIRYLNCDDASSSPRITSTGNLKNFYGSVDCRLLAFTVETLKSEKIWTSNIYLHHMDSLKTYPITRSGGCSDPVIAAGLNIGAAEDVVFYLKNGELYCLPISRGGEPLLVSNFAARILSFKIYLDERDLQQINMCFVMEHSTADNAKYDVIGGNCALERDEVDSSRSGVNHIYICSLNVTEDNLYEVDSTSIIDIMEDIDGTCMNTIIANEIREESCNSHEQNKNKNGKRKNLEREIGPNVFEDSYTVSPNGRRIAISIYDNNSRLSASIYRADLDDFKNKKGSGNSSNEDNRDANDYEASSSALVRRSDNITREKSYAEVSRSNVNENPFVPSIETMDHPPGDYQGPLKVLCFDDDVRGIHSNPVFSPDNSLIVGLFSRTDSSRHEITLLYVHFFNEYSSCWQGMRLLSDLSFESVLWDSDSENGSDEPRMNDLILRNGDGSIDELIEQHFTLYATARFRGVSRIFKLKIDIGPREGSGSEQTSCRYIKNFKIAVMMGDVNRCCISLCLASPLAVRQKNKSNEIQSQNIVCLDTAGREDKKVLNRDRKLLYFLESSLSTPNELKMAILTDFLDFNLFDSIHDMGTEEGLRSFAVNKSNNIRTICALSPEYSNGDIEMPCVTQYKIDQIEDYVWLAEPEVYDYIENTEDCYGTIIVNRPQIKCITFKSSEGSIFNACSGESNISQYTARGICVAVLSVSDGQSYVDIESQRRRVIGYFSRSVNKYYDVDQVENF